MNRILALTVAFITICPSVSDAADIMAPQVATRLGLEQAWRRQLHVPAGAQSIVDQQFFVHKEIPREYVEIVVPGKAAGDPEIVMFRLPTDKVGSNGQPVGKKEAERLARNENRRLKRRGYTGKITTRSVPVIRLYTLGDDGTCECRDAESGESVWLVRVGNRRLGYSKMGVSEEYLTVINGANLVKLDVTNGEEIQSVRTKGTPLFGAVHSGDFSLVATIRNGVEGYPLSDASRYPFMEMVEGIALAPPTKAPGTTRVAWGTDQGFVFVMELQGKPSVLFRLNTDGIVSGRIAAASGRRFFFGSETGQVYGLEATKEGNVLWSRPYGEPFYNDPMIAGNNLLIRSAYGNLYSLGLVDGISTWTAPIPNVDELLAAFNGVAYVRLLTGGMAAIDIESGKVNHVIPELYPEQLLVNSQTDRLYLVSNTGSVQCLRPEGKKLPTVHDSTLEPAAAKASKPAGAQPAAQPDNPFGAAAAAAPPPVAGDPFAVPAGDPDAGDPFATPDDGAPSPFDDEPFK